ncbi:MAG: arsenite methyltransferase [Bacteroidales bacterium]|nr:arsenite methyltransferase [Bacteroidales bacterium]
METPEEIKKMVQEKYSGIAIQSKNTGGSCGCGCDDTMDYSIMSEDYSQVQGYAPEADLGLGCGLPTRYAFIRPGDTVVDMGSGAGNDCFIAAVETGENGKVIGIDMTQAMVEKARINAEKLGYKNVEFHLGEIENTPLEENSTDIVVSNCVFNLAPDKSAAFRETFRILRPGGHLSISDIVTDGVLPEVLLKEAEMYAGCVAGALQEDQYLNIIRETGFGDVTVMKKRKTDLPEDITDKYGVTEELNRPGGTGIYSITVFAKKPQN